MHLVQLPHQGEVLQGLHPRLVIEPAARDPYQLALPSDAQLLAWPHQFVPGAYSPNCLHFFKANRLPRSVGQSSHAVAKSSPGCPRRPGARARIIREDGRGAPPSTGLPGPDALGITALFVQLFSRRSRLPIRPWHLKAPVYLFRFMLLIGLLFSHAQQNPKSLT